MKEKNIFYPKVLILTGTLRGFRGITIAHLYEIAQVYPVILLSEKLDTETEKLLHNKELFPMLERIIPYRNFTDLKTNTLFKDNYQHCKLAKKVIEQYKPDVIVTGDTYLFQLYLARFARKIKPIIHVVTHGALFPDPKESRLRAYLLRAYSQTPSFLPLPLRLFFIKCKKLLAHFIYYWILPLTIGQKPFPGKSSSILYTGAAGLRSCDYYLLNSRKDCGMAVKAGVPSEKLYILPHPLLREKTKEFYERTFFFNSLKQYRNIQKTVTIMYSGDEFGFQRKSYSLISKKEMEEAILDVAGLVAEILQEWKIFVKPHPDSNLANITEIKKKLQSFSGNITVTNPSDAADKYIEISDLIIGPSPASTTLCTASLQCPEKIILSLDFHQELLGDIYKDFNGIEYIDDREKFINILKEIRDNKFRKKEYTPKSKSEPNQFSSFVEAIEYFLQKKVQKYDKFRKIF